MATFHYEWWTVDILLDVGLTTCEFKGKSKETVIRKIKREFKASNTPENLNAKWWERKNQMIEVYWDTLKLDRIGYQRLS